MKKNAFSDTGIILFIGAILLVLSAVWTLNYWKEYDGRRINNHQPIGINEMIYGGLVRERVRNSGMALNPGRSGPMHVTTGSMINQRYFYYFKGIKNSQLSIEYVHPDFKGYQTKEDMKLSLSDGKTELIIPAFSGIGNSQEKILTLTVIDGKEKILAKQA